MAFTKDEPLERRLARQNVFRDADVPDAPPSAQLRPGRGPRRRCTRGAPTLKPSRNRGLPLHRAVTAAASRRPDCRTPVSGACPGSRPRPSPLAPATIAGGVHAAVLAVGGCSPAAGRCPFVARRRLGRMAWEPMARTGAPDDTRADQYEAGLSPDVQANRAVRRRSHGRPEIYVIVLAPGSEEMRDHQRRRARKHGARVVPPDGRGKSRSIAAARPDSDSRLATGGTPQQNRRARIEHPPGR